MGVLCSGICNVKLVQPNSDVTVDKTNKIDPNEKLSPYLLSPLYSKLIYLQIRIKKFLHQKKPELYTNPKHKQILTTGNNEILPTECSKQNNETTNQNNKKSSKNKNKKKPIKYDDEPTEDLLVPTMKITLLENNIFNEDAFSKNIRHKKDTKGDPRDGPFDGKRRIFPKIMEEQSSYTGEWKDGKRDGLGVLCWDNQSKFMGTFYENKVLGFGKLWHVDGDMYKGIWKEYQAEGVGYYQTKLGAYFKGYWKHDKQNGFGLEKWPRGSNFIGEYVDGNKDGIGLLYFDGKAGYEGEFKDGIISGVGTFFFEDDRKYQGEWMDNKMHGYGSIIWPDGNYFEGQFLDDKKNGFGVFYNGSKVYIGMWKNNKLIGNVLIIDNGVCKKQYWEKGKPVRVLDDDYEIYFEKFFEELIDNKKKKDKKEK